MQQSTFLGYLHSFRGFAILCIVIIHGAVMPIAAHYGFGEELDKTDPLFVFNEAFFHASTIYFALISGLLFSAFLKKKGWQRFFKNKVLYVFLPYLFFTLLFSIGKSPEGPDGQGGLHPSFIEYLIVVGQNLVFGKALPIYWYMPVLFCLYAITPILDWIIDRKDTLKWLIAPVILAPLLISRQPMAMGYQFFWQDVVFFIGVYAVGMLVGKYLEDVMNWMNEQFRLLLSLAFITLIPIVILYFYQIDIIGITSIPESLHYVNKLLISGIVLVAFRRLSSQPKFFTSLADDAFAIYFIHFIPIFLVLNLINPLVTNPDWYPWSAFLSIPLVILSTLVITKGLIWLLKKLFRTYSKMIIGS